MNKRFNLELEMVGVDSLNVEPEYQRLVDQSRVNAIADNADPHVCGALHVGRRRNESLWVVDGQHRLEGMKLAGYAEIPCCIFPSKGKIHEAEIFRDINSKNRRLSRLDIHAANLCCGEPSAVELDRRVKACGFEVAKGKYPNLKCVFVLDKLRCSELDGTLEWVLERITAFEQASASQKAHAVKGLTLECLGLWRERHVDKFCEESDRRLERMMLAWTDDDWRSIFGLSGQNRQKHSCDRLEDAWVRCRIRNGKFAL